MANDWIPITERLPETDDYILLSFENFSIPDIGRYQVDENGNGAFYPADSDTSHASFGVFVNAWMPLPKCYWEEKMSEIDVQVKCKCCRNLSLGDWCEEINDCPDPEALRSCDYFERANNADRIRRMKDNELVRFLCKIVPSVNGACGKCVASGYCRAGHVGFIDWLKEEVKDDE